MQKDWEIVEGEIVNIFKVKRTSDGAIFTRNQITFHGPINNFRFENGVMYVYFYAGDTFCQIPLNEVRINSPEPDPCDESHADVWAKSQAIKYAHWIIKRMFPGNDFGEPLQPESEMLYDLFIKETENK